MAKPVKFNARPKATAAKSGFSAKRGNTSFNFGANVKPKGGGGKKGTPGGS